MQINDLIDRVEKLEGGSELARDLRKFVNKRRLGLVYEESKPEYVRLTSKPVVEGDFVNVLPPRGTMEDMSDEDESDEIWVVESIDGETAHLVAIEGGETCNVAYKDLVAVARFDQTIYCGLAETGRIERGGDKPYHTVINGENYHALELLLFPYFQSVDCIYIDPPYNTGAKDWKYNNNYVGQDDAYRHSKWLTFMEDRLRLAKKLLNPKKSVLIVTIDEKEYLRLGLLLEQIFPEARIQMVSAVINPAGSSRPNSFARTDEYIFFVQLGESSVSRLPLGDEWRVNPSDKRTTKMLWSMLKRTGTGKNRADSPNLFYPIYVNPDTHKIERIGETVPMGTARGDVRTPEGLVACWPVHNDGTDGRWMVTQKTLQDLIDKGYVRVGNYSSVRGFTINYLKAGEIKKIENGIYKITGHRSDGSVESDSEMQAFIPGSAWRIPAHDASRNGSNLLSAMIPGRKFPFPKSLYAVEDAVRFFVSDNPDALIVDFFSGSGTTAHATMRLNRQDNGRRRSISVTNNEVSFEEAKKFIAQGLRAGDEEWEAHGIARFITIPRITAAITGLTPDGEAISSDYLPNETTVERKQRVVTQVDYMNPSTMRSQAKKDIAKKKKLLTLLAKGSLVQKVLDENPDYAITDESEIAILFNDGAADDFLEVLDGQDQIKSVFIVTDNNTLFRKIKSDIQDLLGEYEEEVSVRFPMAEGFEENAVFYDLKYLEPSVITANLAFDEIAPLLWMRAGSVGPVIMLGDTDPEDATYEVTDAYGVLFDYAWAPEFIEECHKRDVDHIFVVTDVDRQYRDMCAEFRGKDVKQLYKSYLRSFEIGQDR